MLKEAEFDGRRVLVTREEGISGSRLVDEVIDDEGHVTVIDHLITLIVESLDAVLHRIDSRQQLSPQDAELSSSHLPYDRIGR